ncbi:hypothetical protein ACFL5A_00375 [Gemmatimonadota bacterium]
MSVGPQMTTVLLSALAAACTAYGTSLLFFPALRTPPRVRVSVFMCLAGLIALTPWIVPAEDRIARFFVALYAGVLVLKMWDLHVGVGRSVSPSWTEFLGFMANLLSLVHRRTGFERRPSLRQDGAKFFKSLALGSLGLLALFSLLRLEWNSIPFLVEHLLKATAFFLGAAGFISAAAAAFRLLGAYAPEPMDRPLLARSPADFWRRYNRWIGEGLREDLFRLIGGRRRPLLATLVVLLVSGALHEFVFFLAIGEIHGYQLAFFSLQGVAVAMTLRWTPHRMVGVGATFTFNALSSVLFFASIHGLMPLYEGGLPTWLWGV